MTQKEHCNRAIEQFFDGAITAIEALTVIVVAMNVIEAEQASRKWDEYINQRPLDKQPGGGQ